MNGQRHESMKIRLLAYTLVTLMLVTLFSCSDSDKESLAKDAQNMTETTYKGTWNIGGQRADGHMTVSPFQFSYTDFPMSQLLSELLPGHAVTCPSGVYAMEYTLQGSSDKAAYYTLRDNVWQTSAQIDGKEKQILLKFVALPVNAGFQTGSQATYSQMSGNYLVTLRLTAYEILDATGSVEKNETCNVTMAFTTHK